MEVTEFCAKLTSRYNESSTQKTDDVIGWISRSKITNDQLDTIDLLMQENYGKKSYPYVKDLIDIYKKGYTFIAGTKHIVDTYTERTEDIFYNRTFVNYVVRQEGLTLSQIIKRYIQIEKRKDNDEELSCYSNFFLYIFADMIRNYRIRIINPEYTEAHNRNKTQTELDKLLNGCEVIREVEPNPTKEDIEEIKKLFSSNIFKKVQNY